MQHKKVLITGALGMLGKVLVRELLVLNPGDYLVLADVVSDSVYENFRNSLGKVKNRIEYVRLDILDEHLLSEVLKDCSLVFHLAGIISYSRKMGNRMIEVNVRGTKLLTHLAEKAKVKKIVYASSISAVSLLPEKLATEDDYPPENATYLSRYSVSKIKAEKVFFSGNSNRLIRIAANLGVIIGDNTQFRQILNGIKNSPVLPILPTINSYIDVRDAAKGLVHLSQLGKNGERYIVTAENVSNGNFMSEFAQMMQKNPLPVKVPIAFLKLIHFILLPMKSILPTDVWISMTENKRFSIAKMKELGWQPQFTLRESLKFLIETIETNAN